MSSNENIPEDNPYFENSDNSSSLNLWNPDNQSPNQNFNSKSNPNYITFGEEGVQETYITKIGKNHKKTKSQNSIHLKKNINNNNKSSEKIYIFNNNINIRNNNNENNNNDKINNDINNDKDSKIDDQKRENTYLLLFNNKIQDPFATTNTKYKNDVVTNSLKEIQNNQGNMSNDFKNIDRNNPLYMPSKNNSPNNENERNISQNSNNNINNIAERNEQKNIGALIALNLIKNLNELNINNSNQISINNNNSNNEINLNNYNFLGNEEQDIISKIKKPTLLGLKNINGSSYLNSVLQLISNISPLANYFCNNNNQNFFKEHVKDFRFSFLMSRLCFHLYLDPESKKGKAYEPKKFIEIIQKSNAVYKGDGEKNPNEFIVFLLNKLSEELKNIKFNNINCNIIFSYLAWFKKKEIRCEKSSKETQFFQKFLTLDLNVIDCCRHKLIEDIKIEDCLDFYCITQRKKAFCSFCNEYEFLVSKNEIFSYSKFLIFLIDLKENKNINFIIEQKINLENFIKNNNINKNYELNGIVFFDINKNKYNALCVSPVDKKWYLYDDENVELSNFQNYINLYLNNKNFIPHILLYNNIDENKSNKI